MDLRGHSAAVWSATGGLCCNLIYAAYNGILGITGHSLWFVTLCVYYAVFSAMRFAAVLCAHKQSDLQHQLRVMGIAGVLLMVLPLVLAGFVYLSIVLDVTHRYSEIVMISIAAYTFYHITMAVLQVVRVRHVPSPLLRTMRNINLAHAAVSILSLQRSMMASFGPITADNTVQNALTGAGVCLFVWGLGLHMTLQQKTAKEVQQYYGKIETCQSE